jgi:hypothetical protein
MTTEKYDLVEIDYEHTGWNGDLGADMEKLDNHLHTRVLVTLGEAVSKGEALYQATDKKWYKAAADGSKQPARGLAVEAGAADQQIRMQRRGPFQNTGWNFKPPYKLYLHTVAGELSHHKPGSDDQCMGWAIDKDTVFLEIENTEDVGPAFFGTTTTTITTTTSSTTTTTTS